MCLGTIKMKKIFNKILNRFKKDQLSQLGHIKIAKIALTEGDSKHASIHIANALAIGPLTVDLEHLIDRLASLVKEPDSFVLSSENMSLGYALLRAHLLTYSGKINESINIIRNILKSDHGKREYADWIINWILINKSFSNIDVVHICGLLSYYITLAEQLGDRNSKISSLIPFAEGARNAYPDDPLLTYISSIMLRRSGECQLAYDIAENMYLMNPTYELAIAKAMAAIKLGMIQHSIDCLHEAANMNPNETSIIYDIADNCIRLGKFTKAKECFRSILEKEPGDKKAQAGLFFTSYYTNANNNNSFLEKLKKICRTNISGYSHTLYNNIITPYIGFIPEPVEANINTIKKLTRERNIGDLGSLEITSSYPEAPSSYISIIQELSKDNKIIELQYAYENTTEPDSRKPISGIKYNLWSGDNVLQPVVSPPNLTLLKDVIKIAQSDYYCDSWWYKCMDLGKKLGYDVIDDLLGIMAHPPMPEKPINSWQWMRKVQFAATFTLANIDTGWEGSLRKDIVKSLILGPMDWTVEAGLIAAGLIGRDNINYHDDIVNLFNERYNNIPDTGHVCYLSALCVPMLTMLDIPDTVKNDYVELWDNIYKNKEFK